MYILPVYLPGPNNGYEMFFSYTYTAFNQVSSILDTKECQKLFEEENTMSQYCPFLSY